MKENKGRRHVLVHHSAPAPTRKTSSKKTPTRSSTYYRDRGYIEARVGQPELKILEDSKDAKTRWVELRIPITEGERYRIGKLDFEGNTIVKPKALRPLFKVEEGDVYSEKMITKGFEKAKEVYGSGGYMEFTGYPDLARATLPAMTTEHGRRRRSATGAGGPARPRGRPADRRRDAADAGRQAVLRQPHHLHRQHHHARQRHPARGPAARERRLQHRGAEVQHQAAEPARLLQAARRGSDRRREDAGRRQQGRRQAEVRGAEPQPAHVRRGRVAVRRLLRPALVPDVELPRPRRDLHRLGAAGQPARRTTSSRSASRSCSTGRITAGVDLFIRELQYIGSTRRSRRGGNIVFGFQVRTSRGCSSTTATKTSR